MYNSNLTKEEIRNYLHIYNVVTDWDDESVADEDESVEMIRNKKIEAELGRQILQLCTLLIAERLWRNKREVPLVTQHDVDDLLGHLITVTLKRSGFFHRYATSEKAILEGIQAFAKPTLDAIARDLSAPDAYDDEWRKIEIIQCVCSELNVIPENLHRIAGIGEQIVRRLYPDKESYRVELETSLEGARSGISGFRVKMYQNMLIEHGDELSEDRIRVLVDEEVDILEREIVAMHIQRIEKTMRRIWPE